MFGDLQSRLFGFHLDANADGGSGGGGGVSGDDSDDDDLLGGSGGDGDDSGSGDDDGNDSGDDERVTRAIASAVDLAVSKLGGQLESIVDRRITKKLADRLGGTTKDDGKGRQGHDDEQGQRQPVADVRGARSAFREYLADSGIRFLHPDERAFAIDLGAALIGAASAGGFDDEDRVGREVSVKVVDQVKALRKLYETKTKDALRRRGLLATDDKGQPVKGPTSAGSASEFEKGKQMAAERYGSRVPATQSS